MAEIGIHGQMGLPGWTRQFYDVSGSHWVKVMDPGTAVPLPELPHVKVLVRFYEDEATAKDEAMRGAVGAQARMQRLKPILQSRLWLSEGYRYWLEAMNEPSNAGILFSKDGRKALDAHTAELARIMWLEWGIRTVGYNLGVGHPEPQRPDHIKELFTNGLPALANYGGLWGLHEYYYPDMQGGDGWYTLRYRRTVAALRAQGITLPDLVINECGIDRLIQGVIGGWQTTGNAPDWYCNQLTWYVSELRKDGYVVAATPFTSTPENTWRTYDFNEEVASRVAVWMQNNPFAVVDDIPEPAPQPPVVVEPTPKPLLYPFKKAWPVSSTFAQHLSRKPPSTAPGVDLAAPMGTPILAPIAGKIMYAQWRVAGGRSMWIYSDGIRAYLAHMNALQRISGETVNAGDCVGWVGSSGHSTGPHLHISVQRGGIWLDPAVLW